jgi:hypothetical protein
MSFLRAIKRFFTAQDDTDGSREIGERFSRAGTAFNATCDTIDPYIKRATNHHAFLMFKRGHANDLISKRGAMSCDAADREPYTEASLDSYSGAMEKLTCAFDEVAAAYTCFSSAHPLYRSAVTMYDVISRTYSTAATAYSNAVQCALVEAVEARLQAAKDEFEAMLMELRAGNAEQTDPVAATREAAAFRARVVDGAARAAALEKKAEVAQGRATVFLAKAKAPDSCAGWSKE